MENDKRVYYVIMFLLIFSITSTVIALGYKGYKTFIYKEPTNTVKEYRFFEDNKLHFRVFSQDVGEYECQSKYGYCGWAYSYFDDDQYNIKYYNGLGGFVNSNEMLILDRYAFIQDTNNILENDKYHFEDEVILYDVLDKKVVDKYTNVKNYGYGLENNYYIVKKDGKWGVIQLSSDGVKEVVPYTYEYVGVSNNLGDSFLLKSNKFIVKNGSWFLIDNSNGILTTYFDKEIYDYNDNAVVISKFKSVISFYSYSGVAYMNDSTFDDCKFLDKYVAALDSYGKITIYDYVNNAIIENMVTNNLDMISYYKNDNGGITILVNGEVVKII